MKRKTISADLYYRLAAEVPELVVGGSIMVSRVIDGETIVLEPAPLSERGIPYERVPLR